MKDYLSHLGEKLSPHLQAVLVSTNSDQMEEQWLQRRRTVWGGGWWGLGVLNKHGSGCQILRVRREGVRCAGQTNHANNCILTFWATGTRPLDISFSSEHLSD